MDSLWKVISKDMSKELLENAAHVWPVGDSTYIINTTTIQDILISFVEQKLESYEFKK